MGNGAAARISAVAQFKERQTLPSQIRNFRTGGFSRAFVPAISSDSFSTTADYFAHLAKKVIAELNGSGRKNRGSRLGQG